MNKPKRPLPAQAEEAWLLPTGSLTLTVTLDQPDGAFVFVWADPSETVIARGRLLPTKLTQFRFLHVLDWILEDQAGTRKDGCNAWPASIRAMVNRIRKFSPAAGVAPRIGLITSENLGIAQSGSWLPIQILDNADPWKWLTQKIQEFARLIETSAPDCNPTARGQAALQLIVSALLGSPLPMPKVAAIAAPGQKSEQFDLRVTFDQAKGFAEFVWQPAGSTRPVATGRVRCSGPDQLTWDLEQGGQHEAEVSSHHRNSIRAVFNRWLKQFPANRDTMGAYWIQTQPGTKQTVCHREPPFGPDESPYAWVEDNLIAMADALRFQFSPLGKLMDEMELAAGMEDAAFARKLARKEQKKAEEESRRQEAMARLAETRRQKAPPGEARKESKPSAVHPAPGKPASFNTVPEPVRKTRPPLPPVPVRFELPPLAFAESTVPLPDLRDYSLRERASLWWVSNQSDDLLCLPNCRIKHLPYQLRTALRILGPLRGRALLSDEVGLGKTIEAGLVIKELLTRGMVKRFLILTVPSLVDQWEEELNEKFGLTTVTTNHPTARDDAAGFWRDHGGIVASLHTLKQPAQLEIARQLNWDILVVDEAHYLRNRESQAWQAVNALPRQFLLLLTATPVQNSLEELYNLVTLLQPGQLPTPKEFRARFFDPKHPRQPREPEELRRLLGQVMIRNTRANSGVHLPPRRAETVLFTPDDAERAFWGQWETEFRASLSRLNASQASLWGRLVLQAAGSSPAAWRTVLKKFPDQTAARAWREQAPLTTSWKTKFSLLPPLTRNEGGVVIFTQFLETQAALAEDLAAAGVKTFVINGSTPPPERHPITEAFRKAGGALLLTHSGTEGRNLQFCHRLVNFDLPWNPMEIEQRIGRLHRLGQQQPVRIYNFVQAGTLQEYLLHILQEKLNLFELVIGETGLVLGERFSSDEFAEEILRRWRENDGRVAEALTGLGEELATARDLYADVKKLDATLFAKDYEIA